MKRIFSIAVIAAAVLALGSVAARAEALVVRVTQIKGNVMVSAGKDFKAAKAGQQMKKGYTVKTAAGASCILKWSTGHAVKVSPLSVVSVDKLVQSGASESSQVGVEKGKIYAKVDKLADNSSKFEIKTPTAIAGVRGSEIFVTAEPTVSTFQVIDGSFEVSGQTGLEVVLDQNFQVDVGQGQAPPPPAPIPPEILEDIKVEVEEIKIEIIDADTELEDLGDELETLDEEMEDEEDIGLDEGDEDLGDEEFADEDLVDDELIDEIIEDADEFIEQEAITNENAAQGYEYEPGTGGVQLIIE